MRLSSKRSGRALLQVGLSCAAFACSSGPSDSGATGGGSQGGAGGEASGTGGKSSGTGGTTSGAGMSGVAGVSSQPVGGGGNGASAGNAVGGGGAGGKPPSGGAGGQGGRAGTGGGDGAPAGWKVAWSDEFDGASGEKPDSSKWGYDLGGDGWGNNELEYYTDRPDNAAMDGQGHLVITLKSEKFMNRDYTSARLITLGKLGKTYGRFEARVKAPTGPGVWPAFWMLGADIETNTWPKCGEIDIMEIAGKEPRVNHGSLHGPGYSGGNPLTGKYTASASLADDFHVYAVEWEENVVRWYVDTNLYQTRKNTDVPSGGTWVYDHDFFVIMNVAIGGSFGGAPDASTMLPQSMIVDYVRVYDRE